MRKTRLSIALMTSLLGVCALSGCNSTPVEYSPEGNLISYTREDGSSRTITSEEILKEYFKDSGQYQSVFDAIKSIVIRNYFEIEETKKMPDGTEVKLGKAQMPELRANANKKVSSDKHDAKTRANTNSTSYDKEFESILASKGVKTEEELFEQYLDAEKTQMFNDNYYEYHLDELRDGYFTTESNKQTKTRTDDLEKFWTGYLDNMVPFHVSHILVKISDGGSSNYYNGTISEDDATKLYNVTQKLLNNTKKEGAFVNNGETFKTIAKTYSEDDSGEASSKENYGELGIMDYSEPYNNEFKLGIYAVENLLSKYSSAAQESNIQIPGTSSDGLEKQFIEAVKESYGIKAAEKLLPSVSYKVFKDLYDVRDKVKNEDKKEIMDNSTLVYPRNIIYNKYLNRHSFAFITAEDDSECNEANFGTFVAEKGYKNEFATGLHKYTANDDYPGLVGERVLSTVVAGRMQPIIMVRASSGGDVEGIHFIVVNRDPFLKEDYNGVDLETYYHTYEIPSDTKKKNYFPKDGDNKYAKVYANFSSSIDEKVNKRTEDLISRLKKFEPERWSKFIFKKYVEKEGIKISDPDLNAALTKWMETTTKSAEEEAIEKRETTWTEYIGTLRKQNSARNSLVSEACRIGFGKTNAELKAEYKKADFTSYLNGVKEQYSLTDDEIATLLSRFDKAGVSTIAELYNLEGAPCNDGKDHK